MTAHALHAAIAHGLACSSTVVLTHDALDELDITLDDDVVEDFADNYMQPGWTIIPVLLEDVQWVVAATSVLDAWNANIALIRAAIASACTAGDAAELDEQFEELRGTLVEQNPDVELRSHRSTIN